MSYRPRGRHRSSAFAAVFVSVRAAGRSFIVFGDQQRRIAECDGDCQFWAWPGTYRVRLEKSEHEPESSVRLRIRHSGNYDLKVGNQEVRDGGLLLGVVGSVVSVVGTAILLAGGIETECTRSDTSSGGSQPPCGTPSIVYYGLATLGVGAAMTATGFVLFGTNHTGFGFESEPAPNPITARVGPMPMPQGGLGLGAAITF